MDHGLRTLVRDRAQNYCEYCGLHQDAEPHYRFHIEHIIARQHGGPTESSNLALACYYCNLNKGPNLTAIDPETQQVVPLFHPRKDRRDQHFRADGPAVVGLTAIGRATSRLLKMNALDRLELRSESEGSLEKG